MYLIKHPTIFHATINHHFRIHSQMLHHLSQLGSPTAVTAPEMSTIQPHLRLEASSPCVTTLLCDTLASLVRVAPCFASLDSATHQRTIQQQRVIIFCTPVVHVSYPRTLGFGNKHHCGRAAPAPPAPHLKNSRFRRDAV